ncbi:hypothetical protein I203_101039 [Kwoniella mangroviensis CBS 8507]|uniref:uncharacterized protein n=1 Tax=Kwoniella mangroviensis CBS 8507 TaxID=1296122 RepID=UPI00080D494A|nr:uncharacterized protein I203_02676 [Kwoniella mangroviensis CBS 8507]OCF68017.1 hypothetical protein I203_02676 [Kwoniella mangroviensis CBS 8507]
MDTITTLAGTNRKIETAKPLSSSSTAHTLASDHTPSPSDAAHKLDDRYNDPTADLKIVSSDGVVFKVRSIYLRAASKILDNKITSLATSFDMTLRLEDTSIERATAVRLLLEFLHGRIGRLEYNNLGIFRRAILLAKKYDCELVLAAMKQYTRTLTRSGKDVHCRMVFFLGSILDDIDICIDAIRNAEADTWANTESGLAPPKEWYEHLLSDLNDPDDWFDGECSMDPSTWDPEDIYQAPPRYLAGLLRATRVVYRDGGTWKAAADKFRKVMEPLDTDSEDNDVDEDRDEEMSN